MLNSKFIELSLNIYSSVIDLVHGFEMTNWTYSTNWTWKSNSFVCECAPSVCVCVCVFRQYLWMIACLCKQLSCTCTANLFARLQWMLCARFAARRACSTANAFPAARLYLKICQRLRWRCQSLPRRRPDVRHKSLLHKPISHLPCTKCIWAVDEMGRRGGVEARA